jgi:hypothetical protein
LADDELATVFVAIGERVALDFDPARLHAFDLQTEVALW